MLEHSIRLVRLLFIGDLIVIYIRDVHRKDLNKRKQETRIE